MLRSWCCLREPDIACSPRVLATSVLDIDCACYSFLCCADDDPVYSGALVLSLSSRSINAVTTRATCSRYSQRGAMSTFAALCDISENVSNEDVICTNEGPDRVTKVCKM